MIGQGHTALSRVVRECKTHRLRFMRTARTEDGKFRSWMKLCVAVLRMVTFRGVSDGCSPVGTRSRKSLERWSTYFASQRSATHGVGDRPLNVLGAHR